MSMLVNLVAEHIGLFAAGSSLLLALGALAMCCCKSPAHRLRLGMLSLASVLVWLPPALIPWPRPVLWTHAFQPSQHVWQLPARPAHKQTFSAGKRRLGLHVPRTGKPAIVKLPAGQKHFAAETAERIQPGNVDHKPRHVPVQRPTIERPNQESLHTPGSRHAAQSPAGQPPLAYGRASDGEVLALPETEVETSGMPSLAVELRWSAVRQWLAAIACIACMACLGWLLAAHTLLAIVRRRSCNPPCWLARLFAQVHSRGGSLNSRRRRTASLRVSYVLRRPVVCGLWRPVVLLPAAICHPSQADLLQSVLQHELAHVRHKDAWLRLLANVTLPLLCLHPIYWWICRCVRLDSELLADAAAANERGLFSYASHMIELARRCRWPCRAWPAALGMLGTRTQFYRRMKMLLQRKQPLTVRPTSRWWAMALLGALSAVTPTIVCVGVRPLAAQGVDEDDKRYALRQELLRQVRHAIEELESQGKDVPEALRKLGERLAEPMAADDLDEAAAEYKSLVHKLKDVAAKDVDKLAAMRQKLLKGVRHAIEELESQGKDVPEALRKLAGRLVEPATAEELEDAAALLASVLNKEKLTPEEKLAQHDLPRDKLREQAVRRLSKLVARLSERGIKMPADVAEVLERLHKSDDPAELKKLFLQAEVLESKLHARLDDTDAADGKKPKSAPTEPDAKIDAHTKVPLDKRDQTATKAAWQDLFERLDRVESDVVRAREEVRDLARQYESLEALRARLALARGEGKLPPELEDINKDMDRIVEAQFRLLAGARSRMEKIERDLEATHAMVNKLLAQVAAEREPTQRDEKNDKADPAANSPEKHD